MRFVRQKKNDEYSLGLTALVDIVLLLLIFFILTVSSSTVSGLTVNLPEVSKKATDSRRPSALITLDSSGALYLNGTATGMNELEKLLKNAISETESNGKVLIEADKDAKHGSVVNIMDIVQRSGASSISIVAVWHGTGRNE